MSQTAEVGVPAARVRPLTIVPALPVRGAVLGAVPATGALRVAVLSRHQLTRAGLVRLLSHDDARVAITENPIGLANLRRHDVVVYDLAGHLGGHIDGLPHDLVVLLAAGVPVVALTPYGRSDLVEAALASGVTEAVQTDISADGLVRALERAAAGPSATVGASNHLRRAAALAGVHLTDRELSILGLIGTGLSNQDIAERLFLSVNTVKTYVRSAYRKIGVSRRAEAVLWAVRHGLI